MRLLFIHQGFPGQYVHILRALDAQGGHQLVGLGIGEAAEELPKGIQYFRYGLSRHNEPGLHPWVKDIETKVIRAEACARAASELKRQGFTPDLICGHPGWGELLFITDVWPTVPLLTYQEFFYNPHGFDYDFDPELQGKPDWARCGQIRMKTANQMLNLEASTWCITPTEFQRSSYPSAWRDQISVIHDGIDTDRAKPNNSPAPVTLSDGMVLKPEESIVTFVNRTLEPYRGCHTMIRAIPHLQRMAPEAKLLIVGGTKGVSYGAECPDGEWKDVFLAEIEGQYDPERVHFAGQVPYEQFLPILQLSQAHVYLTYPFVLSWSLLELMACGTPVLAEANPMMEELIKPGVNGALWRGHPESLAQAILKLLEGPDQLKLWGLQAKKQLQPTYLQQHCLDQLEQLLQQQASQF